MRILLVDSTVVGQSALARRIQSIDQSEQETLDLHINLANPEECISKLAEHDVVILGSELGESGPALARQIKDVKRSIEVIVFVSVKDYSSGIFRLAHGAKVRKVIPESASNLDLLQEIVSIHEEYCSSGLLQRGRLIVVAQAKGGVGTTTITAALGEALSRRKSRTVLWDLDIESFDLSRALNAGDRSPRMMVEWVEGTRDPNRVTLQEALVQLGQDAYLLPAPSDLSIASKLVGLPELVPLSDRIANLLRFSHANVIVDIAGRLSPQSLSLLKAADAVLLVSDDSTLGASAIRSFLSGFVDSGSPSQNLFLLGSGIKGTIQTLATDSQVSDLISDRALELPPIPADDAARSWAGSGKTLYSMGKKSTTRAFDSLVEKLNFSTSDKVVMLPRAENKSIAQSPNDTSGSDTGLARRLFDRVALRSFK